jgi:hypothetical protein
VWKATRVLGASLLAGTVLVSVAPAEASTGDDAGAEHGQGFVDVAVAASPEEAAALLDTLRELVARLGLGIRVTTGDGPPWTRLDSPPDTPGERARVWIDARDAGEVSVDVCALGEGGPSPVLHRSVPREGSRAIVVDAVGHVVEATLESALLQPSQRHLQPTSGASPLPDPRSATADSRWTPPPSRTVPRSPRARGSPSGAAAPSSCRLAPSRGDRACGSAPPSRRHSTSRGPA